MHVRAWLLALQSAPAAMHAATQCACPLRAAISRAVLPICVPRRVSVLKQTLRLAILAGLADIRAGIERT